MADGEIRLVGIGCKCQQRAQHACQCEQGKFFHSLPPLFYHRHFQGGCQLTAFEHPGHIDFRRHGAAIPGQRTGAGRRQCGSESPYVRFFVWIVMILTDVSWLKFMRN